MVKHMRFKVTRLKYVISKSDTSNLEVGQNLGENTRTFEDDANVW